ncbi:MAG TPA: hypothetical protein VLJ15_06350, partial [Gammaproteobacteria bacterium]|nr:hypothetical protein [Gammaproteobacteria bacterium]
MASCKNDSEAVHSELEKYVAGNAGFEVNHEANLQQLNLYLASELTEMKCELDDKAKRAAAKPLKEDELYQLRKKAYDDMWAYHQELNNRIEAGLVGRVLHGYGLRAMSEKDLLVSSELTFTLIFQLKRLQGMYIEDGLLVESVNEELANANVARGLALAAKAAHSQKTKAIASFFLGALGAMVIAVAIASVVVLATNPATASVMLPVAFFLFKFQVEAAVVSGLYLLAEFAYAVKKKFYNKEAVLPESTAGKVVLATGVNATALAMAAPAVTGACLVNPATFALSSGVAELATGNATVATATAAAPVAAGLAMIPAAFAAGTAMITRALLSTKRAYYGEGDTLREHAERAFELGKKKKETAQG